MKENGIMGQKAAYTVKKAGQPLENGLEKNWIFIKKKFQKMLDKYRTLWYYNEVAERYKQNRNG